MYLIRMLGLILPPNLSLDLQHLSVLGLVGLDPCNIGSVVADNVGRPYETSLVRCPGAQWPVQPDQHEGCKRLPLLQDRPIGGWSALKEPVYQFPRSSILRRSRTYLPLGLIVVHPPLSHQCLHFRSS